jgi:hypothetical protein
VLTLSPILDRVGAWFLVQRDLVREVHVRPMMNVSLGGTWVALSPAPSAEHNGARRITEGLPLMTATSEAHEAREHSRTIRRRREHEDDLVDGLPMFEAAVHAQVMAATRSLSEDDREASEVCNEIADAIDVLKFAIEGADGA